MFEEITQADLVNKGVEGLPDTPNLETAEMQRKFDEITKEVIVPKFNALIQKLNNDLGSDIKMIDPKDDTSKTLSALIGEIEEEVGLNTADRHNHANKALLDSLTAILFEAYNRLVTMLAGVNSVTDVVTNDTTVLPSGKAIVDFVQQMGGGDMLKEVYDTDNDGVVDNASALDGHNSSYFATVTALQELGSLITALQSLVLAVGTSESTAADTWTALQALKGQNIARLQMNALGDAKIFKSADGGSTWDGGSPVGGDKSDLATVEPGTTATAPYAAGDHVVVNDVYHEVTAAIAIGDTFVEGTNIDVRTVGGEITALNQNLTLNYNVTALPANTDINTFLQGVAEKLYPKQINLNTMDSSKWEKTGGQGTPNYNPLRLSVGNALSVSVRTIGTYDLTYLSALSWTYSKTSGADNPGSNSKIAILDVNNQQVKNTTLMNATSGAIDVSDLSGEYKIAVTLATGVYDCTIQFSKLMIE